MVLVAALTLAILYFALMELLLLDSSRAMAEARNFRGRVVALTLAENGAELAARNMANTLMTTQQYINDEGTMKGNLTRIVLSDQISTFELSGSGVARGDVPHRASVTLRGRIENGVVKIEYSEHK